MFDPVPWFIGGGAEHSPEVARNMLYAATNGAEGIVEGGALKVLPLNTPGSAVRVLTGSALMRSKATGGGSQTYIGRVISEEVVSIASTGATGRTDLIVVRVEDPFMAGEPWQDPADVKVGPYIFARVISNVGSSVSMPAGETGVVLAKVVLPPNTTTVTAGMITDLRKVAQPRQLRQAIPIAPGAERNTGAQNVWSQLAPIGAGTELNIPIWATQATIVVTVSGLEHNTANFLGDLRFNIFGQVTQDTVVDLNWTGNPSRNTFVMAGRFNIPAGDRGNANYIGGSLDGRRRSTTGSIQTDSGTTVVVDITYQEVAD